MLSQSNFKSQRKYMLRGTKYDTYYDNLELVNFIKNINGEVRKSMKIDMREKDSTRTYKPCSLDDYSHL